MTKVKYIAASVLLFMVSFVGGCCGMDAKTAEADEPIRMVCVENAGGQYDHLERQSNWRALSVLQRI